MQTELINLPVESLRNLLILESKKFIWALELGAAVIDLENIRKTMRQITEIIHKKENGYRVEDLSTQKNKNTPNNTHKQGKR